MELDTYHNMLRKWSRNNQVKHLPSNARLITGNCSIDARLNHFENESGTQLQLTDRNKLESYKIIDDKKFMLFTLRWS